MLTWCLQGLSPTFGIVYWMIMHLPECCAIASFTDQNAKAIRTFDKKEEAEKVQTALRIAGIVVTVQEVRPMPDKC